MGEFRAYVHYVSDREYEDLSVDQLPSLVRPGAYRSFVFIVDRMSLSHRDRPILVVDMQTDPLQTFRVIPAEMWSVENNLSLANMDFEDFAGSVDPDGIFRGFPMP